MIFSVTSAVLTLAGNTYHIVGFLYSILLLAIGLLLISCEGLYSRDAFTGTWCDIMRCCKKENLCRLVVSVLLKVLLILMVITTIILSVVQIINLANDPNLTSFPTACPQYHGSTSSTPNHQLCSRVTKLDSINADLLLKQNGDNKPIVA